MKIIFFRKGSANIAMNGASYTDVNKNTKWNLMLRGARSGYYPLILQVHTAAVFLPN